MKKSTFHNFTPARARGIASALTTLFLVACRAEPRAPLSISAFAGDLGGVRTILSRGAAPNAMDPDGLTPLMWAARAGRVEAIHALLQAGSDPNLHDTHGNGWTALLHAIHKGKEDAVRALVEGGARADAAAPDGTTPLMMASGYGYARIVSDLLERGADPRVVGPGGRTALTEAVGGSSDIDRITVGSCQTTTVRALLAQAPDLRLPDNGAGRTARLTARLSGCSELLDLLDGGATSPERASR